MERSGIDIVRIVWHEEYEPLCVEPSADCPGYVRVLAKTDDARTFWGPVDLAMPAEMAKKLGQALQACAGEESNKKA